MTDSLDTGNSSATMSIESEWEAAMNEQNNTPPATPKHAVEQNAVFNDFSGKNIPNEAYNNIEFVLDIPVQLTVELGRTKITIKNLLRLAQGSVVELDGMAGEPMSVLINGCMIAQGEVVVVNDKFGIRLTDIISPSERVRNLNQ
jgi:flagellar motor switch protein FliN/FliY